jgi:hypothetical protein
MTTKEIAERLVHLCQKGDFETAQKELYAAHAVSIEPKATPDFPQKMEGLPAIIKKGEAFQAMTEKIHAIALSQPLIAGNSFACTLRLDITMKKGGRTVMNELCVYEVQDGKIVSEQFHM